jgi:hypothetical protein
VSSSLIFDKIGNVTATLNVFSNTGISLPLAGYKIVFSQEIILEQRRRKCLTAPNVERSGQLQLLNCVMELNEI